MLRLLSKKTLIAYIFKRSYRLALGISVLTIFCIFSINILPIYRYYHDTYLMGKMGVSDDAHHLTLFEYLKAKRYIKHIQGEENLSAIHYTKMIDQTIFDNARLGEALGFLTENVKSQRELIQLFPNGLLDVNDLIDSLKIRKIIAPYGEYNNNYLTSDNQRLIYSDDSDLASLTYRIEQEMSAADLSMPELFAEKLAQTMVRHWEAMKASGEYGIDGHYYGKRGYSKEMLIALAALSATDHGQSKWYYASNDLLNQDNGSLLRAWVIGMDKRIGDMQAYELGYAQSQITHHEKDIAISAGALAYMMHGISEHKYVDKRQSIIDMLAIIEKYGSDDSQVKIKILNGIRLAEDGIDPVLLYNSVSGLRYDDFMMLLSYSFLYFDNYGEALLNIVHTPGDNDSLAFVLGAMFAAYSEQSYADSYLEHIEGGKWRIVKNHA